MSPSLKSKVVPLTEVPLNDAIAPAHEGQHVILIVDDEQIIADTLALILRKNGFNTFAAYDAAKAAALADVIRPHLLISDVMMPGMTGVELAILLSELVPDCKVLLFSGQAATADLLSGARKLGHDFTALTKPVHPTDLLKRVSESLNIPHTQRSAPLSSRVGQLATV